ALVAGNLVALWVGRGSYVSGWDLAAPTYSLLALNDGSLGAGVAKIYAATLNQQRPVFTGGESLVYGLIPGLLDTVWPCLFWGHLLNLALFVGISLVVVRSLDCRPYVYWACILASPALVSYAIVAYPYVPSVTVPYAVTIAWMLSEQRRRRQPWLGLVL